MCNITIFLHTAMIMTSLCMWSIYILFHACVIFSSLFAFHLRAVTTLTDYQCMNDWSCGNLHSLFLFSQGYWVFFVMEGNGPLSSIYKALQVIDFYLSFILPCHPIFGMDVSCLFWGETTEKIILMIPKEVMHLMLAVTHCLFSLSLCLIEQSTVLMSEVVDTKQHNWIVRGTSGIGLAICVIMVKH